jgi:hypothetical protein
VADSPKHEKDSTGWQTERSSETSYSPICGISRPVARAPSGSRRAWSRCAGERTRRLRSQCGLTPSGRRRRHADTATPALRTRHVRVGAGPIRVASLRCRLAASRRPRSSARCRSLQAASPVRRPASLRSLVRPTRELRRGRPAQPGSLTTAARSATELLLPPEACVRRAGLTGGQPVLAEIRWMRCKEEAAARLRQVAQGLRRSSAPAGSVRRVAVVRQPG